MRPIKLELQGFTAFRQFTSLDFDDLELFALVGPTGSGKSSLLDAMTFALYGQTARLKSTGLEALISQGERGLSVSLTFEVTGQTYRSSRTKGRKQSENEVRFERLDPDGRWTSLSDGGMRGINERIQKAVGLDFNTFARSVLLPQGEFSKLLHGSGKDRQALLGTLTGLDHVAVMQRVASDKAKEFKNESHALNTLLEGEYQQVTPEAAAALRTQREQIDAESERLSEQRERFQNLQNRLREQEKIWKNKEDTSRRLSALETRAGHVQEGAQRAERARKVAGVLPLLDAAERARIAHEREARELTRAQATMRAGFKEVDKAEAQLAVAQQAEQRIEDLEARAEALKEAAADAARLKRMGGTPKLSHASPLPWDEDAFLQAREGAQRAEKNRVERMEIEAGRSGLSAALERFGNEEKVQIQETAEQERVIREGQTNKTELEQAQKALDEARVSAGLASHRVHLHVGEPCPLCEQVVRQLSNAPVVNLAGLEQQVKLLMATQEDRRNRYSDLRSQLKTRAKWLEEKRLEYRDWKESLTQREEDLKASEKLLIGDPQTEAQRLLAGLAAKVNAAGTDPSKARQQALNDIQAIRKQLQEAGANLYRAQGDLATAAALAGSAETAAQQRQLEWQEASMALESLLEGLRLTPPEARAAALPEPEIVALEEAARLHIAQLAQLREALAELERQLGLVPFDPAELYQATRDLTATDSALKNISEQAGSIAEQERSLRKRLVRKAEIGIKAAEASRQFDTWQTLTNSLRVTEFQQYLLAEVEAQLLTRAGILLFEISDGRYRLALNDGDYVVQDLWNAGEMRGVKTLSGGETFLASLALAIALSDYLAGNKILGALFLDEGFGTLDPQALEAVAGALENLRTTGRMVGIVTHVESLSERLPSRLLVTKSVVGSSVQRFDS